ncbi:MAG: hypothetical protein AB8E15_06375 [Bdellovibrionales bacterium]
MFIKSLFNLLIIFSLPIGLFAGNLKLGVTQYTFQTQEIDLVEYDSPILGSPSLHFFYDLKNLDQLELSLIPFSKVFARNEGGEYRVEKLPSIYIGMAYNYHIYSDIFFRLGLASAYPVGKYTIVSSSSGGSGIGTSAQKQIEYYMDFGFWSKIILDDINRLIGGFSYSLSLTPEKGESSNHQGVFFGWEREL